MLRLGWCWLKIFKSDLCINASVVGWEYSFRPGRLCTTFCHSPLRSWPNPRIVLRWLEVSVGIISLPESNAEVLAGLKSALLVISTPNWFQQSDPHHFCFFLCVVMMQELLYFILLKDQPFFCHMAFAEFFFFFDHDSYSLGTFFVPYISRLELLNLKLDVTFCFLLFYH